MLALRAVSVSLLALGLLAVLEAGCGGRTPDPDDDLVSLCADGAGPSFARGFQPAVPVDFVGVRTENTSPRPVGSGTTADPAPSPPPPLEDAGADGGRVGTEAAWTATLGEDRRGTPCAGATDAARCSEDLGALRLLGDTCQGLAIVPKDVAFGAAESPSAPQPTGTCSASYFVYTRGNTIGTFRTRAEALAFFGAVDTPEEAAYLLLLGGESISCSSSYRVTADGFDIRTGGSSSRTVHVASDGSTKVL